MYTIDIYGSVMGHGTLSRVLTTPVSTIYHPSMDDPPSTHPAAIFDPTLSIQTQIEFQTPRRSSPTRQASFKANPQQRQRFLPQHKIMEK